MISPNNRRDFLMNKIILLCFIFISFSEAMVTKYLPIDSLSAVYLNPKTNDTIFIKSQYREPGKISSFNIKMNNTWLITLSEKDLNLLDSLFMTGLWVIYGGKNDDYKYRIFIDTPRSLLKGQVSILKNGSYDVRLLREDTREYRKRNPKPSTYQGFDYRASFADCFLVNLYAKFHLNIFLGDIILDFSFLEQKKKFHIKAFDQINDLLQKEDVSQFICYFSVREINRNESYRVILSNNTIPVYVHRTPYKAQPEPLLKI